MIRKIALAGAAGAFALGGLAASGIGSASAAPPTITNATSASIQCNLAPTKAKLAPALKDNWRKIQHDGIQGNDGGGPANSDTETGIETPTGYQDNETVAVVKNLPDTNFAAPDGPNTVSSKSKTVSCTGTITQTGIGTFPVASLKIELTNNTAGTDNPPINKDHTCRGLLGGTPANDVGATYKAVITPKLTGAKIGASTTTGIELEAGGGGNVGFVISGGTTTGPLNGSNSKTVAFVDGGVLAAVGAQPAKSSAPTPSSTICQSTLKIKYKPAGNPVSATLKGPKGLKKINVGNNILPPNQASNICIRKGTTCP